MVLILITTRIIAENSIDVIQSFAISLNQSAGTRPHSLKGVLRLPLGRSRFLRYHGFGVGYTVVSTSLEYLKHPQVICMRFID